MEPKERFEIQLSHVCNNRCVFCVSGQMTELRRAKPTPLPDVLAKFDEAANRGITKVTIMGGEPTIHPTFFPTVKYALELGFETIVIFTNGTRLDKQDFIDRIMAVGKDKLRWRISIQGWDEATHDGTTKRPGSFAKIIKGLETLSALGQHISCNMCVVEQNYRSLTKVADLVVKYNIQQVHLDMVRPKDSGERTEDYLDGIMPDYAELGAVMREMFEDLAAKAPGFDINVGNLPFCQLPDWSQRIHHGGNKTYTVSAEGAGRLSVVAWNKYENKRSDKVKLDTCGSCVFERRCDGFFDLYAKRRGTEQFLPVSREKLRRVDPDQRTFIHQLDVALVALASARFDGWWLHGADDSEFDRWARQFWVHPSGGRATLAFLPAASEGGGDGEHRDFVLRLESWSGLERAQLIALLEGVFRHMVETLGPTSAATEPPTFPSEARFLARRGLAHDDAQLGQAVRGGLARLLRDDQLLDAWTIRGSAPHPQGEGLTVEFSGPAGASAKLYLLGRDAKISGRWEFGRGHEQAKRALAVEVSKRLRPRPQAPASASLPG